MLCAACSHSPGRPAADSQVIPPNQVMDFNTLYARNCAGCHGRGGKGGAAIPLSDPVFLAIADDAAIRRTAAIGVPGTPMPAFAQSAGGMLTDEQIDAIVGGIRSWAKPDALPAARFSRPTAADPGRSPPRGRSLCDVLLGLPRPRWPGRQEGQLHCGWLVPCPGERSESSNRRHCRAAGTGCAGLAEQCPRQADVVAGSLRRCRLAGGAAASISGELRLNPSVGTATRVIP